jgi:hypothetical protein
MAMSGRNRFRLNLKEVFLALLLFEPRMTAVADSSHVCMEIVGSLTVCVERSYGLTHANSATHFEFRDTERKLDRNTA